MIDEEMKNKYSVFVTEISEMLGLKIAKPIDILKLCKAIDLFFRPLDEKIAILEKENVELTDRCKELEAQTEKMKCCENCNNWNWKHCKCKKKLKGDCFKHSKWIMRNF